MRFHKPSHYLEESRFPWPTNIPVVVCPSKSCTSFSYFCVEGCLINVSGCRGPWISLLMLPAKFLETRILAQRIEHWIEAEECRSERAARDIAAIRYRQKFL